MRSRAIGTFLAVTLTLTTVASAEPPSPFKQKYKDAIMRLNADEKNLALELDKLFDVAGGKYRPRVRQLLETKKELVKRVMDYDDLVARFTPNFRTLSNSCNAISAKHGELEEQYRNIDRNADDFAQFAQDVASERNHFLNVLTRLGQNTRELCEQSRQVASDLPTGASSRYDGPDDARGVTRDSDHLHAVVTRERDEGREITFHVRGSVKGDDWRRQNSTKMIVVHENGSTSEVPFSSPGGVRNVDDFSGSVTVSKTNDRELQIKTKRLSDDDHDDQRDDFPKDSLTLWTNPDHS
ncbi:MAG: hypothetical protein IPK07_25400 [Deltaproteobacteria bacterium]|nr:hypothetical protein [Deltaproteobacteria bacterium]